MYVVEGPKPFPYWANQKLRRMLRRLMRPFVTAAIQRRLDIGTERIERILLVRANFRMGNAILATPAISQFRTCFPSARIDFVGSPISGTLYENLPIDHHYSITRNFPRAAWAYPVLLQRLRRNRYDLAVDLSGGSSSMDAFVVGLSGARFRVGSRSKRDSWFNVTIPRVSERNKYDSLVAFTRAMGLAPTPARTSLILSESEKETGREKINDAIGQGGPVVGVFIGGRDRWKKRWPVASFLKLAEALYVQGSRVVVFAGPEERALIRGLRQRMHPELSLVVEPSVRLFASMVARCSLFITVDTGPMHLACALGVRTVAIFQRPNFERWGPPADLARIVYRSGGVSADEVLAACLAELPGHAVA